MAAVLAVVCGATGLGVGPVLSVVAHRVGGHEAVAPLPHCWACHVPVVAWVLRSGRCRRRGARAPARRPLVELTSAVLMSAAALRFGLSWPLPAFCVLFASLVVVSVVDLDHLIISRRVVYPTLCITAPLLALAAVATGAWAHLGSAAIGGVVGFGSLLVVHLVAPHGMGFGDVRLAGLIGMMLGWLGLGYGVVALLLALVLASVVGVALIATRLRSRTDAVPLGPFMAVGAVLAALWGRALLDASAVAAAERRPPEALGCGRVSPTAPMRPVRAAR